MKRIEEKIYDDITKKENNFNQTFMSNNRGLRYFIFIIAKVLNIFIKWIINKREYPLIQDKNVCIVLTTNQFRSVESLKSENFIFIRPSLDSADIDNVNIVHFSPRGHIDELFNNLKYMRKRSDLSWKMYYPAIAYYYYYAEFLLLFRKKTPKSLTITNPTHPVLRAALFAARDLNIPTIYLPHASPSPTYPPVLADYALLEGKDGLDYYSFADYTKKIMVGSPRLDKYRDISSIPHNGINILIATNLLDDLEKVKVLICDLKKNQPFGFSHIILRPHPNQKLDQELAYELGADELSDSRVESCMAALQRTDILIAGNTTTFFEAIYLPIFCFYYDFIKDCYRKDSYNLMSYCFIKKYELGSKYELDFNKLSNAQELERIDYANYKKLNSTFMIKEFYNKL